MTLDRRHFLAGAAGASATLLAGRAATPPGTPPAQTLPPLMFSSRFRWAGLKFDDLFA